MSTLEDAPFPRISADEKRAKRILRIIIDRWERGEPPLRHRDFVITEELASQHLIVKIIPMMQRLAMAEGFYLARPTRSNGYALTLTKDEDTAFLPELIRTKSQASMRLNDAIGGIIKALSVSPDYRHKRLASRLYNHLQAARWNDESITQDMKEARELLGIQDWDNWPEEERRNLGKENITAIQ